VIFSWQCEWCLFDVEFDSKEIIQTKDVVWIGKHYNDWLKNKAPSKNDNKYYDIRDSTEEYVKLNTKEIRMEKDQVTLGENQKIKIKSSQHCAV
jgi:hypothetical protein